MSYMFAQESAGGVRAVDLGNFTAMRGHLHRAFFGRRPRCEYS